MLSVDMMAHKRAPTDVRTSSPMMQRARKRAKVSAVSASDPKEIAARIRARIAEMGVSESSLAERDGKDRSVYSTILRGLADGTRQNLRGDTLRSFVRILGKSEQWILTGEETEGVRLSDLPQWAAVSAEALTRFKTLTPASVEAVGKMRVPAPPKHFDAAFVGALAQIWDNAS
jgi:transcriptional regulator with XRE-family HTH domain